MAACKGHERNDWILDGGATVHITNRKVNLSNFQEHHVAVGGSGGISISPGKGTMTVKLALRDGSLGTTLNLQEVWYMPDCACSAISQPVLNTHGVFYNDATWDIYRLSDKQALGYCPLVQGSYQPLFFSEQRPIIELTMCSKDLYQEPNPKALVTIKTASLIRWHERLGHLNFTDLKEYLKHLGVAFNDDRTDPFICDACEGANAKKTYNRSPQERATRSYQWIHTDMFGPITPEGFLQERYFFTFTCDKNRKTTVFTAKTRDEWFPHLRSYHNRAKTLTGLERSTEKIRSDFGTELRSNKCDKWLQEEGIEFEPSAPYSQEQNGVAESTGRELMRIARAVIIAGSIPDYLWTEVMLAVTHIKDLRPTRALKGLSPYEADTGEKPNLDHLRVLGSVVYVLNT